MNANKSNEYITQYSIDNTQEIGHQLDPYWSYSKIKHMQISQTKEGSVPPVGE